MGTHFQGTADQQLALNVYIKLSRAADAVTTRINQHLKEANLTISQFGVLEAIYHLGPLQPSQLATKILKSEGNLTLVITNLVKRELVARQRRQDDRRCIEISLTAAGETLMASLFPRHVDIVEREISVLSPAEQEELARLCRKLGLRGK